MENETRLARGMKKGTRVLQILAKIVWICAFIGAAGCLIGGICLSAVKDITFTLDGALYTVEEYLESTSNITYMGATITCFSAFIGALAAGIEGIKVEGFFKSALRENGYFNRVVAKGARDLAIFLVVTWLVAVVLQGILSGVAHALVAFPEENLVGAPGGSFLFFLILSLFLYRGTELIEAKKEGNAE